MVLDGNKGSKDILKESGKQGINTSWRLNIAFVLVIILSISAVGFVSFRMIAQAVIDNARSNSKELIKQTAKNIEVILKAPDDISTTILSNDSFKNFVKIHSSLSDQHKKAQNERRITEILDNYIRARTDIADIAVITNKGEYITSGYARPSSTDDALSYYAVRRFRESKKEALWLDTYWTDVGSTGTHTDNFQVFSIVKNIRDTESNKSNGILLLNIKESYLYGLVSDVKLPDHGQVFIIGKYANYVTNPKNRYANGFIDYFRYKPYLKDVLKQKNGWFIKEFKEKDYLITFNTIDKINGIDLGWTIVGVTPVESITGSVTKVGMRLLIIGLGCIITGFIISILITRFYNKYMDKRYSEKHAIVMERERLASLGQLIGGIAHNFKTPIMSIAGGLEALKDLADEYDNSIDDGTVTERDHHEIAGEMRDWVKRIKPYCTYMSDIISTVKGQAVNLNESTNISFTVDDLLRRVEILMSHELKRYRCEMNIKLNIDVNTPIKGEINNLVQVMNNLISNSIESYNGETGKIDVLIDKKGRSLEILIRDYGCGIPEDVKKKLLKEMITTKGKKGTGLGLYMSYSTIKGKFGGIMNIESEIGKGTSIYISIPL